MIEFTRLEEFGQIKPDDSIVMICGNHRRIEQRKVYDVLYPGKPFEAVLYKPTKAFYFTTAMVIAGKSWVKECYVIRDIIGEPV